MTVIYKEITTRPSLEHQFWFHSNLQSTVYNEDNGKKLITRELVGPLVKNGQRITGEIVNSYYLEMITWPEVFLKKDMLRPDLKYLIELHNLTHDNMEGIGPPYNPFSLTYTSFSTYNNWDDFLYDDEIFWGEYKNFENIIVATENSWMGEYFVDGVLVKSKSFNYKID